MSTVERLEIDHILVVCNGCHGVRKFVPDAPLIGADALIEWMKTQPTKCSCGALTCDIKAHMKGQD